MKVKLLQDCWLGDKAGQQGKTYDLSEKGAKLLVNIGKAEKAETKQPAKKQPKAEPKSEPEAE